jgi:CDGSH-type Zn-finger protein
MLAWMSEELESHAQRTATARDVQKSANELAEAETLLRRALMCLCGMSERKIKAALAAMRED